LLRDILYVTVSLALLLPFAILIEQISPRDRYSLKDRFPAVIFAALWPASLVIVQWPLRLLWGKLGIQPLIDLTSLHLVLLFIVGLLLIDFLRYWEHRFEHRFMWRFHAVHHSPTELHASKVWGHPMQGVAEFAFISVPMSFIDTGVLPLALGLVVAFQNLVIHSPITAHAGPMRAVYVDNRFHRIHHSTDPTHFEKNFGIMFSFWDRLFGTGYYPKEDEWPAVGVQGFPPPKGLIDWLCRPFTARF